nr:MAG TPA: hypothetical protein [Caudoviricetes sp.]
MDEPAGCARRHGPMDGGADQWRCAPEAESRGHPQHAQRHSP